MATFRLPHFSASHTLQTIDPPRLIAFLEPYRPFFRDRGVLLPDATGPESIPYDRLVEVFMSPDDTTPRELIDALFYVDGLSTAECMHALLAAAEEAGLRLGGGDDVTPADIAVQTWLLAPELVERTHAEQYLTNPKSFEYFQTDEPEPTRFRMPTSEVLQALERELDDWFADHRRGRTARVFAFERPEAAWFLVRHGEPYKREESIQGVVPSSVAYRPLKYDVLVYDHALGELRIHAQLKGEKELYREAFGRHLFGRHDFFPDGLKYTLEPLRGAGQASLRCSDLPGLEWVRLKEIHYAWGGVQSEYEIVKAADVFAALSERSNRKIPTFPRLARAVFSIKFQESKRPRSVTIKPPNVALYARDQDAGLVEQWLLKRGFLNVHQDADDQPPDPILVSA